MTTPQRAGPVRSLTDLASGSACPAAHDAWFLSAHEWRAGFLQAANAGWRWKKSWRLWLPPHDDFGLREIDSSIRHEMGECRGARSGSMIIIATDADFIVPWFGPIANPPIASLTFAAFSEPAHHSKGWTPGDRVPKGPREDVGYGDWECRHLANIPGLSWYWRADVMERAKAELKTLLEGDREHAARKIEGFAQAQRYRGMAWQAAQLISDCLSAHAAGGVGRETVAVELPAPGYAMQSELCPLHPVRLAEYWMRAGTKGRTTTELLARWLEWIEPILKRCRT